MALTRLPGSKWWIETSDDTFEITGTYNKAAIIADIQAIRDTLALYPSASQEAADYADVLTAIATRWTVEKRARITAMLDRMWAAYGQDPRQVEIAQLQAKLDTLIILRDRLV